MKKISIHIEKLGPIRNADIELAQFMLFTGASNLGKSYIIFWPIMYSAHLPTTESINLYLTRLRVNSKKSRILH